jgi:hypothetical protein
MPAAIFTIDGEIRVRSCRQSHLRRSASLPTATARVHWSERHGLISQNHPASGLYRNGDAAGRRRSRTKELAVGGVTEIKVTVPPAARHEIRTRSNCLRLERLQRSVCRALGNNHGRNRGFKIERDHRYQMSPSRPDLQRAVILAPDLARYLKNQIRGFISSSRDRHSRRTQLLPSRRNDEVRTVDPHGGGRNP